MTNFQLDTSGFVVVSTVPHYWNPAPGRVGLDAFTQGYVEALLRDAHDTITTFLRFDRLAPETLATIIRDCACHPNNKGNDQERLRRSGRNAWEDRNPHGALYGSNVTGTWFPPLTPTLGDDGKVRFQ